METLSQMAVLGASLSSRLNRTMARLPPLPVGKGPWTCCVTDSSLGWRYRCPWPVRGGGRLLRGTDARMERRHPPSRELTSGGSPDRCAHSWRMTHVLSLQLGSHPALEASRLAVTVQVPQEGKSARGLVSRSRAAGHPVSRADRPPAAGRGSVGPGWPQGNTQGPGPGSRPGPPPPRGPAAARTLPASPGPARPPPSAIGAGLRPVGNSPPPRPPPGAPPADRKQRDRDHFRRLGLWAASGARLPAGARLPQGLLAPLAGRQGVHLPLRSRCEDERAPALGARCRRRVLSGARAVGPHRGCVSPQKK